MKRRGEVAKAAERYKNDKETGESLSAELKSIQDKFKVTETNTQNIIDSADAAFKAYKERYEKSARVVFPNVEPIGQNILITSALYDIEDIGLYLVRNNFSLNSFKEVTESIASVQTVVAVGSACQQIKKGMKIYFNPGNFIRIKNPNSVKSEEVNDLEKRVRIIDDYHYILLHERDVDYIIK